MKEEKKDSPPITEEATGADLILVRRDHIPAHHKRGCCRNPPAAVLMYIRFRRSGFSATASLPVLIFFSSACFDLTRLSMP